MTYYHLIFIEVDGMDKIKECLLHLFKNDPENPYLREHFSLLAEIGNELEQKGNIEEAALFYEKAISCTKLVPFNWYMALGKNYLKNKRWKEAENIFRKILEQENAAASCYAALAQSLKGQKRRHQEISSLEQAVALDQNQPEWWYRLGELYEYFESWDRSATAYDKAVALNGNNPQWIYRKGYALERYKGKEEAQQSYETALSLDGSQDCLRFGIGVFHQKRHFWPEAAEAYKQQLTLSPHDSALIIRLATAYQRSSRWEEAIATYKSAESLCESPSEKAECLYKTGICLERLENMGEAAESYTLALSTQYKAYWCYRLGYVLKKLGKYAEACSAFQNQRRDLGLEASNAFQKITSESIQKLCKEAISTYREMISEDTTHPEYFFYLACWLELVKQSTEAIQMYKAALARSSEHRPEWWHRLGCALMRANKYQDACEAFVNVEILRRPYALSRKTYNQNSGFKRRADYVEYHEHLPLVEHTILYESMSGNAMGGNPYMLFIYMLHSNKYKKYTHIWSLNSYENIRDKFKKYSNVLFVKRNSDAYLRYLNSASLLINDYSFPQYFIRKEGQLYLNTWHGSRIKSAGKEIRSNPLSFGNTQRNFLQCTHMISPNHISTDFLINSYDIKDCYTGKIKETGFPRIDRTLTMDVNEKNILKKELQIDEDKKIILYAPTWREKGRIVDNIDLSIEYIQDVLETCAEFKEYVVLFRPHQKLESRWKQTPNARIISQMFDSNELLAITDILITDYSSICFDFMSTEKPIIFYIHDIEEYSKARGLYFRPDKFLIDQCCYTKEDLKNKLLMLNNWKPSVNYLKCKRIYCSNDDGKATERSLSFLFNKDKDLNLNKKIKILLYAGNFSNDSIYNITLKICNYLKDNFYSISIIVNKDNMLKDENNVRRMFLLPNYCKIIIDDGNINTTIEEDIFKNIFMKRDQKININEKNIFNKIYKREYQRRFGNSRFDILIDLTGYDPHYAAIFGCSEIDKFIIFTHKKSPFDYSENFPSLDCIKKNNIYTYSKINNEKDFISLIKNIKNKNSILTKRSIIHSSQEKTGHIFNPDIYTSLVSFFHPQGTTINFIPRDSLKFIEDIITRWNTYNKNQLGKILLENIIEFIPNQNWAHYQLYFIYRNISKIYSQLALSYSNQALQGLKFSHPYQEQHVNALRESGNMVEAIRISKKVIKFDSQLPWPYHQLFLIYRTFNNLDKALEYARILLKIQPENEIFQQFFGEILFQKGDKESAINFAEKALTLCPNLDWAYSLLAYCYVSKSQKEKAICCLQQAIQNHPENITYYKRIFDLFIQCNNVEEAISIAKKLVELDPKEGWPYIYLSRFHDTEGDLEQAIRWRQKAIEVEPQTLWYREYLAELLRKKGDIDGMAQVARDALSMNTRLGWAYIQLSRWYDAKDKLNEAIACRQRAIEIHPEKLWYREYLFELLWKKGDIDSAAEVAREAIKIDTNLDWAYMQIARWQKKHGKIEEAIKNIKQALKINPNKKLYTSLLLRLENI